jgi:hypothetical protein
MKIVRMPRATFIREHKKLIRDLRYGNRRDILKQATKQSRELNAYLRRTK